ncbi:hypothetical protein [Maritalea sp.]|jgi:5'-deoxynucleotidase YfbR-like HD superfamily hydrolase|uniref:hypothetical protein n=1 Tax=Maritalea sp. TaxID=2003361 RepID=UPI0039E66223
MNKQFIANMANGDTLSFNDPAFGEFKPEPTFRQLSYINRWAGNLTREYNVLQHSMLVAEAIDEPELKIYGLLHDVPENSTGDVTGPYKDFIDQMSFGIVKRHEAEMLYKLCESIGIAGPAKHVEKKIHRADMIARATELRDVVAYPNGILINYDPMPKAIAKVPREELIVQALDVYHTYLALYFAAFPVAANG